MRWNETEVETYPALARKPAGRIVVGRAVRIEEWSNVQEYQDPFQF